MRDGAAFLGRTREFAAEMMAQRALRQARRHLDRADFERLRDIGFLHASVPTTHGGAWENSRRSIRVLSDAHRILGAADSSLALSASMHPGVLAFWRDTAPPEGAGLGDWEAQKREVFKAALGGAWWGTITSEPGTSGDIARTRAVARRDDACPAGWRLSGEKHFGSGSGITSFMITTAVPEGEAEPAWFFLDVRNTAWDGTLGMTLRAEWDGNGMAATDSHAFTFRDFPATRFAWPGHWRQVIEGPGGSVTMMQVAVIVGIVDAAMAYMEQQLRTRGAPAEPLPAFDKVEWVAAQREAWLVRQAYEGGLRALEAHGRARLETQMAKSNVAILAESLMTRLCRIAGGGSYSRRSPLAQWFEDVRAMGFLRPPWSIALDGAYALGWAAEPFRAPA